MSRLTLTKNSTTPPTPPADKFYLYLDTDEVLKAKNDAGVVITFADVSLTIPSTIVDAKGDLIAGTAADAVARLAAGANGQVLSADAAQSAGLKYVDPTRGIEIFRHVGTSPVERWYVAGMNGCSAPASSGVVAAGFLYGIPFLTGRGGTIDRISVNVTTGGTVSVGTGKARLGLYRSTSLTNLYPGALVADLGEVVTTSTGVKTLTISQALDPNSLYWVAIADDCDASAPVFRGVPVASQEPIFGIDPTMPSTAPHGWVSGATFTYGAMPDPFTAGATPTTSNYPMIAVRYSA